MKKEIHPELNSVEVKCSSCGTEFATESTKAGFTNVEVCSKCHPFYTGKTKNVSKGGRVAKFNLKYASTTKTTAKTEEN
ncbi:MAG: 50S ribosomal protein L31 [Clostridiales bacterium GWE2_32_10]|nr:MAG: 50S ribosomal protein L31 [Clostridiales bacterium GWE2_32_10]HBY20313.1 50S ribosomal protein L31 [Clostridiales bacterium]